MGKLVKACSVTDLKPGSGKVVDVEGVQIALFNVEGKFFAIDNTCKHHGGPLGEGALEGSVVACPWHGWMYDVKTGKCQTVPGVSVDTFSVTVKGQDVYIEV